MSDGIGIGRGGRLLGWGAAAALLLAPLVAMLFTAEVSWGAGDFLLAATLIGGAGLAFELAARRSASPAFRAGAATALAAILLLIWMNLAVGLIGDEGNPANLLYAAVPLVALAGAAAARFRPRGLARAALAAAATQALVPVAAFLLDAGSLAGAELQVPALTLFFVALWVAAAWLFGKAARRRAPSAR